MADSGKVNRIVAELEESIRRKKLALYCQWDVPGQHGKGFAPLTKVKTDNGEVWRISGSYEDELKELGVDLTTQDRHDLITHHKSLNTIYVPEDITPDDLVIVKPGVLLSKRPKYKKETQVALMNLSATIAHAQLQDFNVIYSTIQRMDAHGFSKLLNDYNYHAAILSPDHQRIKMRNASHHSGDLIEMLKSVKSTEERDLIVNAITQRQEMYTKLSNLEVNVAVNHMLDVQEDENKNKSSGQHLK